MIDTQARPSQDDLEALAGGCDLLVVPTTPDALALDALLLMMDTLKSLGAEQYRILITVIPPKPSRDGEAARSALEEAGSRCSRSGYVGLPRSSERRNSECPCRK